MQNLNNFFPYLGRCSLLYIIFQFVIVSGNDVKDFVLLLLVAVGRWFSARFCLIYLAFFGFVNVYALRVNLSVAIISMVNSSYLIDSNNYSSNECIVNTSHQKTMTVCTSC